LNNRFFSLSHRIFLPLITVILSLVIYVTVLMLPLPKEIGLAMRFGLVPVILYVTFLLYPAFRLPGRVGTFVSFSLTSVLFALVLSGIWNSGISTGHLVGGLLPYHDPQYRYVDSQRLLEGGLFETSKSGYRPLFSSMFAVILGLTQQNLQATLAIFVLITAISGT
jgi:hypothetical protein